jgi:hypothetical protein
VSACSHLVVLGIQKRYGYVSSELEHTLRARLSTMCLLIAWLLKCV